MAQTSNASVRAGAWPRRARRRRRRRWRGEKTEVDLGLEVEDVNTPR
jgi:hypothetical protein